MKHIIPLLIIITLLTLVSSCSQGSSPNETVLTFLNQVEQQDFQSLETVAPFITKLSAEEQLTISDSLQPYSIGDNHLEIRHQGFKNCTVFLTNGNVPGKTLIMSLKKEKKIGWIISNNISYKQNFDFIPLERTIPE